MLQLCQHINAPIKPEKVVTPTTQITFLGIAIDTVAMTASISDEHKLATLTELQSFTEPKKPKAPTTLTDWQTVIHLQGRPCWMNLSSPFNQLQYNSTAPFIYHPRSMKRPGLFLPTWSGISLILDTTTGHLALKWNSLLMLQVGKVGVPSGIADGYSLSGHSSNHACPLCGESFTPSFVQFILGVTCGPSKRSCFIVTTQQWLISGIRDQHTTQRQWHWCACYIYGLHTSTLTLQSHMYVV